MSVRTVRRLPPELLEAFPDEFRPFFGPQWLRFVPALRRMCRKLDRVKTVAVNNGSWRGQAVRFHILLGSFAESSQKPTLRI